MRNLIKGTLLGGLLITGLVGALLAQTTKVSPVNTITCSGGDFVSALAATGIFTCSTPAAGGLNQLTGDVTAGPGTGSQAATLANTAVTPATYTNPTVTFDSKGRATAASNGTGGGVGSGIYAQVRSATPTAAGTGLTTSVNLGTATATDGLTGYNICGPTNANQHEGKTKTAPSTPYSIDVAVQSTAITVSGGFGVQFGWYDGTKLQIIMSGVNNSAIAALSVLDYATVSTGSAANVRYSAGGMGGPDVKWLRIKDDGTNVFFQISPGGDYSSAQTLYTVAKASGYLANYDTIWFGIQPNDAGICGTLLSYTER